MDRFGNQKECWRKNRRKKYKKHRNDIFRLAVNIDSDVHISISENVDKTIKFFIEDVRQNSIDLKNMGIKNTSAEDILQVIEKCYILDDEGEENITVSQSTIEYV